jgi:hypothetical protein
MIALERPGTEKTRKGFVIMTEITGKTARLARHGGVGRLNSH